ncbi:aspartate carbamoyltransferase [Cetobacterium sp. 2A]|uniref:aspartate carbamoyltransferase n=1 Tax=Cetobacterium sp. 2A TaxID=2754723 RepID=UPI00163BEB38|nr:aspartate carbamoyltransferase [Cetobacterium sp. 2A]MBC2855734.1 aspartate carbamoyltransferase [Cetobacterium sp. 2A]
MNSFISMKDFTKEEILEILEIAKNLKCKTNNTLMSNDIVSSLFFEPSTRTRLSFTSAAYRLGGKVLGFDSPDATSLKKGETLRDTIKMTSAYSDVIVMRHPRDGAARFAEDMASVPVINAGDGSNEHPSQTLLDLYTIQEEMKGIENLKVAFVGDLKYGRTVHSLTKALSMFNCEFFYVAPDVIQIPEYILKELKEKNIKFTLVDDFKDILKEIDVLYMTRIQKERFENIDEYEQVKNVYEINKSNIIGKCKEEMIILHPLPRVDEISIDLDDTKHALYFKQASNGVPVREAMFAIALNKFEFKREKKSNEVKKNEKVICSNKNCITHFEVTENKTISKNNEKNCYYCGREVK